MNVAVEGRRTTGTGSVTMRAIDIVAAALILTLTAPLLAVIVVAIRATSAGPALFVQERVGLDDRVFSLYKFRTMAHDNSDAEHRAFVEAQLRGERDAATSDGAFKLDDPRVTRVGAVLRRYSLDELPQLLNVLQGSMSLVGPRPSLPWEVDLYTEHHRRRTAVRPGCTGLWQVSGRNQLSTLEMLDLDLQYVERKSLLVDLWILLRTPFAVLRGDGAR